MDRLTARRTSPGPGGGAKLHVVIPHTDGELTRRALERAAELAAELDVEVVLVAPQVVPFPRDLEHPVVSSEHTRRQLSMLACSAGIDIRTEVVLARDMETAILHVLESPCLLLIATHRRPWRTAEERLARNLIRNGQNVVLLHCDADSALRPEGPARPE